MTTLVATALLAIVLFVGYSASRQSHEARAQAVRAIRSALEAKVSEIGRTAQDYAWWNDAVRNLDHTLNPAWADSNVGLYIHATFGYDTTYVVDRGGRVRYCALDGIRCGTSGHSMGGPIEDLVDRARAIAPDEPGTLATFLTVRDRLAMVGASPITVEPGTSLVQPDGPRPVLIYAQQLDGGFLERVGHDLGIAGLRIVPFEPASANELPLIGPDGVPVAFLTWQSPRLGRGFIGEILPALVLSIVLIGCFTWHVLRQARKAAQAVEDSEARFRDVSHASSDWIWETDRSGRLVFLSERFHELTGRTPEAFLGRPLADLLAEGPDAGGQRPLCRSMILGRPFRDLVCQVAHSSGQVRLLRFAGRPAIDRHGNFRGYRGTASDVTAGIAAERQARHLGLHDPVTGLPNRELLRRRLDHALEKRGANRMVAVLLMDLDRFKSINDTLGHAAGDKLITLCARRLEACIQDSGTVARLGGDEFALVQTDLADTLETRTLCRRLLAVLQEPFDLAGHEVAVTGSIGVAFAPEDTSAADQLLQFADMALYRAKEDGRNAFRFFEPEMDGRQQARRALERDLRSAVARGDLEVHYQLQLQLDGRGQRPVGVEALLRWQHPERGWVAPAEFIAVAEESGLILPLGEFVLRTACTQVAQWPELSLSVNLSPVQFRHGDLVELVQDCLATSGLQPARLELEITESVLLRHPAGAIKTLSQLRELGVHIAMDDFGAGYSSLGYLQQFAFDTIKIDRSFIGAIETRNDAGAIVRAVVGLGRSLGIRTCAEGVETAEQLAFLEAEGCDQVQGFYFSHALPAHEISLLLAGAGPPEVGGSGRPAAAACAG